MGVHGWGSVGGCAWLGVVGGCVWVCMDGCGVYGFMCFMCTIPCPCLTFVFDFCMDLCVLMSVYLTFMFDHRWSHARWWK